MAWPAGVTLRTCSLGPDFGIVSGDDYGCDIVVSVSRPMMTWGATGSGGIGDQDSLSFTPGMEITFQLPVTDQAGWYIGGLPIDVSDGQQSHVYTLTIKPWIYNSLGRKTYSNATLTLSNLAVPTGDDTLDLDKSVATSGAQGGTVTIPDLLADLQASVDEYKTELETVAAAPTDAFVAGRIEDPASQTTAALNATIGSFLSQLDVTGLSTAAINTWLALPSPLGVKRMVGTVTTTAPLVLASGTYHDFTSATITAGFVGNVIRNRAAATTQRTVTDAATTSGSTTITSASAGFTSTDVGRSVVITNGTQPIVATITAVTNATTAVLSAPSAATVAGAAMSIYTRDKAITLVGGTFNRGANGGVGTALHSLLFRRVDGLRVRDVTVTSGAGKYAISIGDCTDFAVDSTTVTSFSDGVHICGPSTNGYVGKIFGTTGDDSVTITPSDYPAYNDVVGPVSDVVIEKVYTTSASRLVLVNGGSPTTSAKNITVRDVLGTCTNLYGVLVADDNGYPDTTGGVIDNVLVENVANVGPVNQPKVFVGAVALRKLTIRDVPVDEPGRTTDVIRFSFALMPNANVAIEGLNVSALGTPSTVISLTSTASLASLALRNSRVSGSTGLAFLWVDGTITEATIDGVSHGFATGSGYLVNLGSASARIDDLRIRGSKMGGASGGGGLIAATNAAHTLPKVLVANTSVNGAWLADLDSDTTLTVSNVAVSATSGLINIRADSACVLRGSGLDASPSTGRASVATGGSLSIRVPGVQGVSQTAARPAIAVQAAAGTGASATIDGTDADGTITLVTGTTPGGGYQANVTFVTARTKAPRAVIFTPLDVPSAQAGIYVTTVSASGFHVTALNVPAGTLNFAYRVDSAGYGD